MKILFKFTTRSRPHLFRRGLESILNNVTSKNFHVLVSCDVDDKTMNNNEIGLYIESKENVSIIYGESKSKIDAINRDVYEFGYDWDILVNMSDDMVFITKGFDKIIRSSFLVKDNEQGTDFERELDLCLHFPDGNRNDLITMAIMGRTYYNRFDYIYHPEYKSLYCDNEMTDVAKLLGCYRFVNKDIVRHLHPAYGKAVFDKQYQYTESFSGQDAETYYKRKAINFGI